MDLELALRLAAAVGLGVLLGLERQHVDDDKELVAGVRTMGLISLLGGTAFLLGQESGLNWLVPLAFAAVAALALVSYSITARTGGVGITTEVTVLIVFVIGVLCVSGRIALAAAIAVTTLLLLALKEPLHGLARGIQAADVKATLEFAIITVIVLPLLPNQGYGPTGLEVINPYKIWLMVVLISAVNFAGYVLIKVVGNEQGLALTGALGGLASSTALTLGFSQRSTKEPDLAPGLALGIMLAWAIMFVRVVLLVAVVSPSLGLRVAPAMALLCGASLVTALVLRRRAKAAETGTVAPRANPFELSQAIKFGLLFGVVTFVSKAAEVYLGQAGLYLAAGLAGLTDVDAIALSMANLAASTADLAPAAAKAVLIAVLANTLVKSLMALGLGSPSLRAIMLPIVATLAAASVGAFFLIG